MTHSKTYQITAQRCPQPSTVALQRQLQFVPTLCIPTYINVYFINTIHTMMHDGHQYNSIKNYNTIKPRRNKRACVDDNDAARTARRS